MRSFGRRPAFSLVRPELGRLGVATLCLLVSSGIALAIPQGIRWAVDRAGRGESFLTGSVILLALGALGLQAASAALRTWLFTSSGERVVLRLRERLYRHLLDQDTAFFDQQRTGELLSRLDADTTAVRNALTVDISHALRHVLGATGGIVLLVAMSPRLAAGMAFLLPIVGIGTAAYGRRLRRYSLQIQDCSAAAQGRAEETLSTIRTVRTFAREPWAAERYRDALLDTYRVAERRARATGTFVGVTTLARMLAVGVLVVFGMHEVATDQMTLGAFSAFVVYATFVGFSLGTLTSLWGDFMKASGASRRVFELLDQQPILEGSEGRTLSDVAGRLEFRGVTFHYPSRPEVPALRDVSLVVAPGEQIALIGPSGSGKSTLTALVSRLYDPDEGALFLDGVPFTELDPYWLRDQVGVVRQEPVLFAASIRENILYGDPSATPSQVEAAARAANAHDFISELPDGYDAQVGERGVRLSGGQKQRIAIARALLKDPPLLVLDEATSALDPESEHAVRQAIERLMEGRTTLIVTHRIGTVQRADRIVVLTDGAVREQGLHEELVRAGGTYSTLLDRHRDVA